MKKKFILLITLTIIYSCSSSKALIDGLKYFDEDYSQITKSKFNRIKHSKFLLNIEGDSIHHRLLSKREEKGKLNNHSEFISTLEKEFNTTLHNQEAILIIYYPGKDPCNSGGTATYESMAYWHYKMQEGLKQILPTKTLLVFKNREGLTKREKIGNWKKDPKGIVEKTFFKYHYPCSSFVMISQNGSYISHFGEFAKKQVWNVARELSK